MYNESCILFLIIQVDGKRRSSIGFAKTKASTKETI